MRYKIGTLVAAYKPFSRKYDTNGDVLLGTVVKINKRDSERQYIIEWHDGDRTHSDEEHVAILIDVLNKELNA